MSEETLDVKSDDIKGTGNTFANATHDKKVMELCLVSAADIFDNKASFKSFMEECATNSVTDIYLRSGTPIGLKFAGRLYKGSSEVIEENLINIFETIKGNGFFAPVKGGAPAEFSISVKTKDKTRNIRFRGTATACELAGSAVGIDVTLRASPGNAVTLEEQGLNSEFGDWFYRPKGLSVITGKTGTGKTTLIGGIYQYFVDTRRCTIITYEKPIEFTVVDKGKPGWITQSEIGRDLKTFKHALPNLLRRQPDVILYGEVRDKDEINALLQAALAGQYSMGTLHTDRVYGIFRRMAAVYPHDEQAGLISAMLDNIQVVLHQRLLPVTEAYKGDYGERVAVREFLDFDVGTIREDCVNVFSEKGIDALEEHIRGLQQKMSDTPYGKYLPTEIERLFKRGIISEQTWREQTSKFMDYDLELNAVESGETDPIGSA